ERHRDLPVLDQHPRLDGQGGQPHQHDQGAPRMIRVRSESGQVTVMAAAMMVFLIAMVAFVLDVGSWFRQQRVTQSNVAPAALAGAQALPSDPQGATTFATTFANKNAGLAGATITVNSTPKPNAHTHG